MSPWLAILIFVVITVVLCVGAYIWGTIENIIWKKQNGIDPKDPDGVKKWYREKRWKEEEELDKRALDSNPLIKEQMKDAFEKLMSTKFLIERMQDNVDGNAELCLRGLTSQLFLEKYDAFKTKDKDEIKDAIYKDRPYYSINLMIFFAIYIFEHNKNIDMLKLIIKSDDPLLCSFEDKELAKKILERETQN